MSGHTKGPWNIQDDHGRRWIETNGNDDTIAEIHRRREKGSVYSCNEALANAHLIAAAPDLLEVLQAIIGACDRCEKDDNTSLIDEFTDEIESKARAAIARAKGQ